MTLSIKGGVGMINEPPVISGLKAIDIDTHFIKIQYTIHDLEMTYCRQYLILNGEKTEITAKGAEIETDTFEYLIDKLNAGTNYNIQIEASDGHDIAKSDNLNVSTLEQFVYGVRVEVNNSNPRTAITYIEDAKGMEDKLANSTSLGGWADKWPYKKIRIVGLKNGQVVKEIKKENKKQYIDGTTVGTDVDVMVEIPKIYWKFSKPDSEHYELRISNEKLDDNYVCLAHTRNKVEKDFLYIGAYQGAVLEDKLRSISGKYAAIQDNQGITTSSLRLCAKRNSENCCLFYYYALELLRMLFVIAYKNFNSQSALGYGACSADREYPTGSSDTLGFVGSNSSCMCFLGVENLWGNLFNLIDGIYIENVDYYTTNIYLDKDVLLKDDTTGYSKVLDIGRGSSHYINQINATNILGFFPTSSGLIDGSSHFYCDQFNPYHTSITRNYVISGGQYGKYNYTREDFGLFCLQGVDNLTYRATAPRLVYF